MFHRRRKQVIAIYLASCALAACGGGGGGGGAPPPATFTVGGSISGLVGSVTLQNTGGAQLTVSANGSFAFTGAVAAGSSYAVTVAAQPELQSCTVANGGGTAAANVTNIAISCTNAAPPTLSLSLQAIKAFHFAWSAVPGVTRYKLLEDATGNSGFTQAGADIGASATSLDHIVPLYLRANARYVVQACAASRCIDSNTVSASGSLAEAVGYFKAQSISARDEFGRSIALSADGTTLAVGVPGDDSNATGVGGNPDSDDVHDSGAVYVFVRNGAGPTWQQQAYIKASNTQEDAFFGLTLALDSAGSRLAVGAPRADSATDVSGAVYVFERSNGVWTQQALLTASNAGEGDLFGVSVALSDQGQLAVGATNEDGIADSAANSGAVYVFVREAAGQGFQWRQDAYLKASNLGDGDEFGSSVGLSRDGATLAVGARREDSGGRGVNRPADDSAPDSGAAYVFTHAAQWTQQAFIKASNTGADDSFGLSLALSADGSTLAVGADAEDSAATGIGGNQGDNTATEAGAAYVFVRSTGIWSQQAYIKASDTTGVGALGGDRFGASVALSADGSTLAVAGPLEDGSAIGIGGDENDISSPDSGAVYVFERFSDAWAQRAYVKPSNTKPDYLFGFPVALSGDGATLAACASRERGSAPGIDGDQDSPPIDAAGAVYLY